MAPFSGSLIVITCVHVLPASVLLARHVLTCIPSRTAE